MRLELLLDGRYYFFLVECLDGSDDVPDLVTAEAPLKQAPFEIPNLLRPL